MAGDELDRLGESVFGKRESISSELFSLTYGSMVVQLLKDHRDDVEEVNRVLHRMGYNIGERIVDEFLVHTGISSCKSRRDTADIIAKVAFRMFLGVVAEVSDWSEDASAFSIVLASKDNPLVDFVELPPRYSELSFCSILCGCIRGALEMVRLRVECSIVKDSLKGDDVTEIRVVYKEMIQESYAPDQD